MGAMSCRRLSTVKKTFACSSYLNYSFRIRPPRSSTSMLPMCGVRCGVLPHSTALADSYSLDHGIDLDSPRATHFCVVSFFYNIRRGELTSGQVGCTRLSRNGISRRAGTRRAVTCPWPSISCQFLQHAFENLEDSAKDGIVDELLNQGASVFSEVVKNQWGAYCIQHILEHGSDNHRQMTLDHLISSLLEFSTNEQGAKSVTKALKEGGKDTVDKFIKRMCDKEQRAALYDCIRGHIVTLRGCKTGSKVIWLFDRMQAVYHRHRIADNIFIFYEHYIFRSIFKRSTECINLPSTRNIVSKAIMRHFPSTSQASVRITHVINPFACPRPMYSPLCPRPIYQGSTFNTDVVIIATFHVYKGYLFVPLGHYWQSNSTARVVSSTYPIHCLFGNTVYTVDLAASFQVLYDINECIEFIALSRQD
ncbi:ARM repeat-containing protein [Salix suchowensis]|nr:ARM repeat-containing protein [Salix suchowensis]